MRRRGRKRAAPGKAAAGLPPPLLLAAILPAIVRGQVVQEVGQQVDTEGVAETGVVCYEQLEEGVRCNALRTVDARLTESEAIALGDIDPLVAPSLTSLGDGQREVVSCYLYANESKTFSRCAVVLSNDLGLLEKSEDLVIEEEGLQRLGLARLSSVSAMDATVDGTAQGGIYADVAVCRTRDTGGSCHVLRASSVVEKADTALQWTLSEGQGSPLPGAQRNLAVVPFGDSGGYLATCYEDLSHAAKPQVAMLKCAILRQDGLRLVQDGLATGLLPPPLNGVVEPADLDPDQDVVNSAKQVRYELTLAPLSDRRLLLCYLVVGDCRDCRGHFCEVLNAGVAGATLSPTSGRGHFSGGERGSESELLSLAPVGGLRAVLCFRENSASGYQTVCELLKALGDNPTRRFRLSVRKGEASSLNVAPMGDTEAVVCHKMDNIFEGAECDVLHYSRNMVTQIESIAMGSHVQASDGRTKGLAVIHAVVPDRVYDVEDASSGLDLGEMLTDTSSPRFVAVMGTLLLIVASIRICFRSTWLCAYWCGCEPPPPPEIEIVVGKVVEDLSPRVRRMAEGSPRLQYLREKGMAAMGDISPRLARIRYWMEDDLMDKLSPRNWDIEAMKEMISPRTLQERVARVNASLSPRARPMPQMNMSMGGLPSRAGDGGSSPGSPSSPKGSEGGDSSRARAAAAARQAPKVAETDDDESSEASSEEDSSQEESGSDEEQEESSSEEEGRVTRM